MFNSFALLLSHNPSLPLYWFPALVHNGATSSSDKYRTTHLGAKCCHSVRPLQPVAAASTLTALTPGPFQQDSDSTIVSMTRYLYHVTVKSPRQRHRQHDSATPSPLGLYITPLPSRPDNAVASITQHLHRAAAKSPRQHCRQHDSTSTSRHGQVTMAAPSPA
jgi:hypothetical protein